VEKSGLTEETAELIQKNKFIAGVVPGAKKFEDAFQALKMPFVTLKQLSGKIHYT